MQTVSAERHRDYHGPITNTDIWDGFKLRPDDIIVDTPPKCGTTWTLNIVMMLIYGRVVPDAGNREAAPWLDCALRDRQAIAAFLNGLDRRRCIKSHTAMDGIAYGAEPTYIVVYRNPIDVHFSLRTHAENMKDNNILGHMFPEDEREGFHRFVDNPLTNAGTDDMTISSIAHHFMQAQDRLGGGNVHFFHYADLTRDLRGQIARLADILEIPVSVQLLDDITEANTFASMRKVAEDSEARFSEDSGFHDEAKFFASGTSNKWEGRLTEEDLEAYDNRINSLLNANDAAWLNWGDQSAP